MKITTACFLFFIIFLSENGFSDFFEYNLNGQPIAIVNDIGKRTSLEYDEVGRPVKIIYSDGKIVSYQYGGNDNRTSCALSTKMVRPSSSSMREVELL